MDLQIAKGYTKSEDVSNIIDIVMDSGDHILIELDPEAAPITVANFQKLVSESFYDGLIFHRIIPGFMIQGGDPTGTGRGGSAAKIKGEFLSNGVDNRYLINAVSYPWPEHKCRIQPARSSLSVMETANSSTVSMLLLAKLSPAWTKLIALPASIPIEATFRKCRRLWSRYSS